MEDRTRRIQMTRKAFLVRDIWSNRKRRMNLLHAVIDWITKRRQLLLRLLFLSSLILNATHNNAVVRYRSVRRFPRNVGWFQLVWSSYSDNRFKNTFRVSRTTFTFLLERIRPNLERDTVTETPIDSQYAFIDRVYNRRCCEGSM
ncbi:predicted protein [Nematostella vectensis]|uniref:Uncharacterized protein n=1 Tax=Nematostella vectensis TaxID=45351 RepID=A7SPG6_NEMVE|nr:predicted protein [Nematostella vectensis]|eukprot:XP_001626504.1 predicted protein [Nematostella vectensis]